CSTPLRRSGSWSPTGWTAGPSRPCRTPRRWRGSSRCTRNSPGGAVPPRARGISPTCPSRRGRSSGASRRSSARRSRSWAWGESAGEDARYLHHGLGSSDVVDTALSVLMVRAADLIAGQLTRLHRALAALAVRHRGTVMAGRTHGIQAEPITFGLKAALWYAEIGRGLDRLRRAREAIAVGKISGEVGTYAHTPPEVEAYVCAGLGLRPAPVSSQIIQRDRHAEYLTHLAVVAGTLEKIATEIRTLQRTELGEVEEPFREGQTGSSAMPH